ncbi:hypothetical protein CRENPOLYSF2_2970004 [Crenothrix polyspora]|uniref:Calcium-binding protein n=1 Tax=Crenothrix polyspora TaxID=360316 RepID=A0A1R4H9E0_9GAMM|nr:calcium-binding protein [Crenothrix polyspora]SJM92855.1 hypothetical protein CRENPOLYSF2_2970004 [Crenothrix polyspora]
MKNLLKKIATAQRSDTNLDRQFNECNRGTAMKLHHSIILISAVALCLPLSVNAGEAKRVRGVVEYNDNGILDNSANEVIVGLVNGRFRVTDTGDRVTAGEGCSIIDRNNVECGDTNPSKVKMDLAGGKDSARLRVRSANVKLEINGGEGNDTLKGGGANDTLNGGGGDDTLNGVGGADTINGDFGNDVINGGSDNDILDGGPDQDILKGEKGADTLRGGFGNDRLTGGSGEDSMFGDQGDDKLLADDNEKDTVVDGGFNFPLPFPENDKCDVDSDFLDTVRNCEQIDG